MTPKIILFAFCLSTAYSLAGQDVIVANLNSNILYLGIDNPIDFASKTIPRRQILLTTKSGKIGNYQGRYFFFRDCGNQPGVVVIYAWNKRTKKLIDSIEFRLRRLPDPNIRIVSSNMSEGIYVGTDSLKDIYGVTCYYSNDFTDENCQINGFTATISNSSGSKINIHVTGNRISSELKIELANVMVDGDFVTIHDFDITVGCIVEPRLVKKELKLK